MKFFHLSDLHIGKQLYHYNLMEEQRHIFQKIIELAKTEQPDAVVLAGDIYDSPVPSAEAVGVFDEFLTALCTVEPRITVLLIAGNHDSAKRLDFASDILAKHQVYIAGMPPMKEEERIQKVVMEDMYGAVNFYLLPFVKPSYVRGLFPGETLDYNLAVKKLIEREQVEKTERNVLVSHQFYTAGGKKPETADSEVHLVGGIENVDVSALLPFDYAALGHIHRPQKMGEEQYRYCGTPLAYSVSEAQDEKSVTVVELQKKGSEPLIRILPLSPLRRVHKLTGTLEEILAKADESIRQDYVSIILTDEVEVYQPKAKLEECFERILEIRVDNARTRKLLEFDETELEHLDPYDSFLRFFEEMNGRKMTKQEEEMIKEVMNQEMEEPDRCDQKN